MTWRDVLIVGLPAMTFGFLVGAWWAATTARGLRVVESSDER